MSTTQELGTLLAERGVSRRTFLKFCTALASVMALPPGMAQQMADNLAKAKRPSVIWMSCQECTGCTESLVRSASPSIESLILDLVSLDYHEALMAPSGHAAEQSRIDAMERHKGEYLLLVDGSITAKDGGVYSTVAGITNLQSFKEMAKDAAAVIAIGTCATFGGIPMAKPNPTGAVSVQDVMKDDPELADKPLINISGCPPIPVVMSGVLAHYVTFGSIPALDSKNRPQAFFGETIHDRCYRRPFYEAGKFARSFDDDGARKGWCLFELGCKAPVAYNACATVKWNQGTSFPIQSGHGCFACSEPNFWDQGGLYKALSQPIPAANAESLAAAAAVGVGIGAGAAAINRARQASLVKDYGQSHEGGTVK